MMKNKFVLALLSTIISVSYCKSHADNNIVDNINQNGTITIILPDELNNRVSSDNTDASTIEPTKIIGYRVQVFSDSNSRTAQNEANRKADAIAERFPDYKPYIIYDSPHWRLRVGNFRTKEEAENAAQELKDAFPNMKKEIRVVKSYIEVFN